MKKKLVFVINTMGRAGAETALIELLRRLDATGQYELSLFTIIPSGELFCHLPKNVRVLNRKSSNKPILSLYGRLMIAFLVLRSFFYRLTGFKLLNYMRRNYKEQRGSGQKLQYDKLLWRLLADGRPSLKEEYDLAIAYIEGASTYYVADRINAHHKVAFIHTDYIKAGYTPQMDQDCYRKMERVYVVSKEVGERFRQVYPQYGEKINLFRNLLDKEGIYRKAETETGFMDNFDGIRLVTVGRLHYYKGYDLAIEAMAKIRNDGYKVRWYVIGEGMERSNLEQLIKKYTLEDSFILMGAKENPYPYMKQADIYVHATRFEGKSIAIEEAQILGKAILASKCTGNSEQIVSGYDGVLVELTVESLVAELEKLIDDRELRNTYAEHVLEKKLDFPEDLENMLKVLEEGERVCL